MIDSNRPEYNTPEYKSWRYQVMSRDGFACTMCKQGKGKLQAHHIKRWADAEHLRYAVSNGVTLCEDCHAIVTGHEESYEDYFNRIVAQKKIEQQAKGNIKRGKAQTTRAKAFLKWRPRNPHLRF